MNINDVKSQEVQGDRLVAIFARQEELVKKYQEIEGMPSEYPFNPHSRIGQKWFKDFAWRMTEEMMEAFEAFQFEEMAMTTGDPGMAQVHRDHYNEELADALHFLVENLILIGITPQDLKLPTRPHSDDILYDLFDFGKQQRSEMDIANYPTIHEIALQVTINLGLAMNCLKNKPWKQTEILTDVPKFKGLMIKTFYSFITLLIWSDLNDNDITDLYFRKSEVNKFRQRSKY